MVCIYRPITTMIKPLYHREPQFAICESCFWCANIFQRLDESNNNNGDSYQHCPLCKKSISLVHLAKDENIQ
jgi:hypothetical protein